MNIARHNYEEYFILYMDNELSSDERRMVETFVQTHPDLQEELQILQQYKLVPDSNIVFKGKEELMKAGGESPISLSTYEEWLLLFIDNELTADQRKKVEQFITANPSVKKEADILLKTKLQAETIVFASKEVLYRREEKVRTIPILWWRVAAAVLIVAVSLTSVIIFNKKGSGGKVEIAKAPGNGENINEENQVTTNQNISNQQRKEENKQVPTPVIDNTVEYAIRPVDNNVTITKKKNTIPVIKMNNNIPVPIKKNEEVLAETNNNKPTNNLPQPLQNRTIINDVPGKTIAKIDGSKEINKDKSSLTKSDVTTKDAQSSDIRTASLISNTDDADLNQSSGKKSKFRGFFRKVTRTFEKRTNIDPTDNDEKLLVGGLAIRLK